MANIRDVATMAGVGIGTVSRTLSNKGYVSQETREKILAAANAVGYKYEATARPAPRREAGVIGVVVPVIDHPFFTRMINNIEMELFLRGYKCLVSSTMEITSKMNEFMELLDEKHIDGIIALSDPGIGFKGRQGRPIVCLDRDWGPDVPMVRADHEEGGRLAAEAFLEAGCKKVIQFFSGDHEFSCNVRHNVMEKILKENGCDVMNVQMSFNSISYPYNKNVIESYWRLISQMDGCMTNDIGALSCLAVANKKGVKVPEELKIIGYDGTEITNLSYPAITVIEQDCPEMARACVESVISMIEGNEPEEMLIKIPVKLKKRGTT